MMNTLELIRSKKSDILAIATRHGAKNVRVFGSVARGEDTDTSDVDLLVSMEKNRTLYDLIGLQQEIQDILNRNVDVLTDRSINRYLQAQILQEATLL
ncbi:MAG: nucleotidyltransferase family protein [Methylotenera sp.]|nr:nucleotidyltransferase family protein [Methylotenera sp.]MDD4925643.1 nucleotidyltransferase family protein [Methylotenera sp.]